MVLPPTAYHARRGLFIECEGSAGMAVLLDASARAEYTRTDGSGTTGAVECRTDRDWHPGPTARLRLVLRDVLTELYLDDMLVECVSLPAPATGRIGLAHGGSVDAFARVTTWC